MSSVTGAPHAATVDSSTEGVSQLDVAIEAKRKELLRLEAERLVVSVEPTLVTAVMPVRDAFLHLAQTLFRLAPGAQSVPLELIIVDGGSDDPCRDILSGDPGSKLIPWLKKLGFRDARVLPPVVPITRHHDGSPLTEYEIKNKNIEWLTKKLVLEVKTPYTFFVDSDVDVPVDCVRFMLEMLEHDPELALAGVLYDWAANHTKLGCSLGRTSILRDIDYRSDAGCPCRELHKELVRQGHKVEHVPPETRFRDGYGFVRMVGTHKRFNWR